jgi:heme oxygenase (biliverdin-IX-beta and delta-forming)
MWSVNLALDELRAATSHCHRRLEKRLDIPRRFANRGAYRAYLEVMFGYYAPVEQALSLHSIRRVIPDFDSRRKASLLAADLLSLGLPAGNVESLPRCPRTPIGQDEAAAFGSLYVLEGATLGGQVLLALAKERLQVTEHAGASYLGSYGSNVQVMWQRFCVMVEDWCHDGARRAAAAAAAVATFESLEDWMCGADS